MKLKLTLIMGGILAVTGCGGSGEDNSPPPTVTVPGNTSTTYDDPLPLISDSSIYNDIGVHDPSIVKVDDTYYVFGSHLDTAKSTDLMSWQYVSSGVSATTLFEDSYEQQAAVGIEWTDDFVGSWAADVIASPEGKFWFYYNHCGQDNPNTSERDEVCWHRSYIGLAVADNVEGPYVDQGIFLRTGYRNSSELETYPVEGVDAYNPAVHPNGIDPAAFYDKDGNLWMVYGSYSGGIYVLAMDETTGMPEAGQGYGTHLVGGDYNAIEGSFVIYSPDSDYYYLFWSNGGFAAEGGYNIRVARSKTPDGPYLDADGNDMVDATVGNDYGTKLLGSHLWVAGYGDASSTYGYNAVGHNSALYDADLDKYLLFTHTRFPAEEERYGNAEAHSVRVHEMWLNEDDWLVVSPHRYAPIDGDNIADAQDIAGDYRLILQGKDTNNDEHTSVYVTLSEQGRQIQGDLDGSYKLYTDQPSRIRLTIDEVTYEGVAKWQWNVEDERFEVVVTAMSASGESLLAAQLPEKTVAEVVEDIAAAIDETFVNLADPEATLVATADLWFPSTATRGAQLTWSSSDATYLDATGKVTRPNVGEGDQTITMTATVDILGQTLTVSKDIIVAERSTFNRVAHFNFEDSLADALGNFADGVTADSVAQNSQPTALYTSGQVGQALNMDGSFGVMLPTDVISNHTYTISFWLNQQTASWFTPALFAAQGSDPARWYSFLPVSWDGNLMLWSNWVDEEGNVFWYDGITGVNYPVNEWHHVAFAVNNGAYQIYYDGQQVGSGSGLRDVFTVKPEGTILTLGLNFWDAPMNAFYDELKVYDDFLSAAEIKALDVDVLPASELLAIAVQDLSLGNIDSVLEDLVLPYTGPFTSALSWSSSDSSIIDETTGVVTRPERGEADAQVTLTATITLDGQTATKDFNVTVISKTPPTAVARFSFEDNVEDSMGNFAAGAAVTKDTVDDIPLIPTDEALTYVDGIVGKAIQFDGDSGPGVELPDGLITDYSYSVALWLNPAELNQYTTTFFGYASANSWISVVPSGPDGALNLWSGSLSWFDGQATTQIDTDSWSHVVFVVNEGAFYAYVNGELVNTLEGFPDVFTAAGSSSGFSLATNLFPWDANFTGLMDELVIYDDPLSADDVAELYAEGNQ